MKHIQKAIMLEPFISRLPSVVPSYDTEGKLYTFDYQSVQERNFLYTTNYGLYPSTIKVGDKLMSWPYISDAYAFLTKYFHLLNYDSHCGMKYKSALEFFEQESEVAIDAMPYGTSDDTYAAMDDEYGRLETSFCGHGIEPVMNEALGLYSDGEDGLYTWLTSRIVPTFYIPSEYENAWNRKKLFYHDAIGWMGWFKEHHEFSAMTELHECSESDDCCTCTKYVKLGGATMLELLTKWVEGIEPIGVEDCVTPNMVLPISIVNSMKNLGNEEPLIDEYVLGKKYSKGNIVNIGNEAKKRLEGGEDYIWNPQYMEMAINDDVWELSQETEQPRYKYYSYKYDGPIVTGNTKSDVQNKLFDTFPIYDNDKLGFVYEASTQDLYPISKGELFSFSASNNTYLSGIVKDVGRMEASNTPVLTLNGVDYLATLDTSKSPMQFFFTKYDESKTQPFKLVADDSSYKKYYKKNGNVIAVTTSMTQVQGYVNVGNERYIVYMNKLYDGYLNEVTNLDLYVTPTQISGDEVKLEYKGAKIYSVNEVSGRTSSNLRSLKIQNRNAHDLAGNTFNGTFTVIENGTWYPTQGAELEPLYQVGNFAHIQKYEKTKEDKTLVLGDIITDMVFYYKDALGNDLTKVRATKTKSSLTALKEAYNQALQGRQPLSENVYCDVTYQCGAVLKVADDGYTVDTDGIIYKETVQFKKTPNSFYIKKPSVTRIGSPKLTEITKSPLQSAMSYIIYTYELVQETETIDVNSFGQPYDDVVCTFETNLGNKDTHAMYAPTIRREYLFGVSAPQNVDSDIYIERGINAAFEKHLKLGEVASLDALTSYGNGYFTIQTET